MDILQESWWGSESGSVYREVTENTGIAKTYHFGESLNYSETDILCKKNHNPRSGISEQKEIERENEKYWRKRKNLGGVKTPFASFSPKNAPG